MKPCCSASTLLSQ